MSLQYHKNKIKNLEKLNSKKSSKNLISVVYMQDDGTIDYPENCAPGVLVVPRKMTLEEWEAAGPIGQENSKQLK